MNNLPKVVTQCCLEQDLNPRPTDLLIASPNALPLHHRARKCHNTCTANTLVTFHMRLRNDESTGVIRFIAHQKGTDCVTHDILNGLTFVLNKNKKSRLFDRPNALLNRLRRLLRTFRRDRSIHVCRVIDISTVCCVVCTVALQAGMPRTADEDGEVQYVSSAVRSAIRCYYTLRSTG